LGSNSGWFALGSTAPCHWRSRCRARDCRPVRAWQRFDPSTSCAALTADRVVAFPLAWVPLTLRRPRCPVCGVIGQQPRCFLIEDGEIIGNLSQLVGQMPVAFDECPRPACPQFCFQCLVAGPADGVAGRVVRVMVAAPQVDVMGQRANARCAGLYRSFDVIDGAGWAGIVHAVVGGHERQRLIQAGVGVGEVVAEGDCCRGGFHVDEFAFCATYAPSRLSYSCMPKRQQNDTSSIRTALGCWGFESFAMRCFAREFERPGYRPGQSTSTDSDCCSGSWNR